MRSRLQWLLVMLFVPCSLLANGDPPRAEDCEPGDDQFGLYIRRVDPPELWVCGTNGWVIVGLQGAQGVQGVQGIQGEQGEQGVQGPAGPSSGLEVVFISSAGTNEIWTNQPTTQTELMGSSANRKQVDLANFTQFRIIVGQAVNGAASAALRVLYSTNGSVWTNLESSPNISADLNIGSGIGLRVGMWAPISSAAKSDVQLRIDGLLGNGTADPAFRQLSVQFK